MGRPAGRVNVAGRIRAAFRDVTEGRDGQAPKVDLRKLMEESLNDDFLGTIRALGRYIPLEMMMLPDEDNEGAQEESAQIFRLQVVAADGSIVRELDSTSQPMESEPIEGQFKEVSPAQGLQVRPVKPGEA